MRDILQGKLYQNFVHSLLKIDVGRQDVHLLDYNGSCVRCILALETVISCLPKKRHHFLILFIKFIYYIVHFGFYFFFPRSWYLWISDCTPGGRPEKLLWFVSPDHLDLSFFLPEGQEFILQQGVRERKIWTSMHAAGFFSLKGREKDDLPAFYQMEYF